MQANDPETDSTGINRVSETVDFSEREEQLIAQFFEERSDLLGGVPYLRLHDPLCEIERLVGGPVVLSDYARELSAGEGKTIYERLREAMQILITREATRQTVGEPESDEDKAASRKLKEFTNDLLEQRIQRVESEPLSVDGLVDRSHLNQLIAAAAELQKWYRGARSWGDHDLARWEQSKERVRQALGIDAVVLPSDRMDGPFSNRLTELVQRLNESFKSVERAGKSVRKIINRKGPVAAALRQDDIYRKGQFAAALHPADIE